jgi:hypothetical protein
MLTISVQGMPGSHLRTQMFEMLPLSQKLGCIIEMQANGVTFWVYPSDTKEGLIAAFDRLYPGSEYVSTNISNANPHLKADD